MSSNARPPTSRNYCFTWFLPEGDDIESINSDFKACFSKVDKVRYVVWQLERCPDTQKLHYQGYCELSSPMRISAFKNKLELREIHLEPRRGNREQARDYCRKEDSRVAGPWELGEWQSGGQGKRTDIAALVTLCQVDANPLSVARAMPDVALRYPKGISLLCSAFAKKRTVMPTVYLFYGPTGVGKTRFVHDAFCSDVLYRKVPDTRWFDGYCNQDVLLLDDFTGAANKMSLSYVLQLLDVYPISVEVKGSYVPLLATRIFITSNLHPRDWYDYSNREEQYRALIRRFTYIVSYDQMVPFVMDPSQFQDFTPRWDSSISHRFYHPTQTFDQLPL